MAGCIADETVRQFAIYLPITQDKKRKNPPSVASLRTICCPAELWLFRQ
jgi:hypothetical protein